MLTALRDQLNARQRRISLLHVHLDSISKLTADGYPASGTVPIPQNVLDAINKRIDDARKAAQIFAPEATSSTL